MIKIEDILDKLIIHNVPYNKLQEVKKAYDLAADIHKNQFRQSGEPYIVHPLEVATNLLTMEIYDPDTISAALLHDGIEDSDDDFSKEDIARIVNPTVAYLVDGVSKMRRMDFNTKEEQNLANFRKIINGITKDARIILIKLADRLHNMRTLEYKTPEKQIENSKETMNLYVSLALTLGAYQIKSELEDLSLRYLDPDKYFKIKEDKELLLKAKEPYLLEMREKISAILKKKNIPNEILLRTKNICTIYKIIARGYKIENIYDLFYLKVLVDEVDECYQTLGLVHKNYPPINGRFKDYIYNPRTNLYQSLHTSVSTHNNQLTKVKIRTHDMDKVSAFGVPALWNMRNGKTIEETQTLITDKFQFAKKLIEIDESFDDNKRFVEEINRQLLTDHVYVYNNDGEIFELPSGSTSIDYVCHILPDLMDKVSGILINGKEENNKYVLQNNDRIQVITKGTINHENISNINYQKKKKI